MSSNETNKVQVQNMQKEVLLHQLVVDLWHNLLENALDTGILYGVAIRTALNQEGGGNGNKKEQRERGIKRSCNSETLYLPLLKTLCKKHCPSDPG